jgi:DMSO/TMAO reductase YedYZ molybdopterin-dependent catalytic subunit
MTDADMTLSRRDAMIASSSAVAGLAFAAMTGTEARAQDKPQAPWPDHLVEKPISPAFPVPLPLLPDGSAPEHPESEAGPIIGRLMWHTADKKAPPGESDYRKMAIKVDTRGLGKLSGTLRFSDLEKLPRVSHTFLLQCGTAEPHGIVKWTGVKFADFADMLGLVPGAHYCRLIAADQNFYMDEAVETLRHPQVMLAWMMNDQPIPMDHGAPLRLIVPFRYGNRSIKAIKEISFSTPGTLPPLPA